MHIEQQEAALRIIGIELRTSNHEAMQTIPPHWQRFTEEGVLVRIPGRLSDEVCAIRTHFENAGVDNGGIYSLFIGAPVFEEYLNNPRDTAPANLLTEICLPLARPHKS